MAQAVTPPVNARVDLGRWLSLLVFVGVVIAAVITYPQWQPVLKQFVSLFDFNALDLQG